jgi:hypothetical protein
VVKPFPVHVFTGTGASGLGRSTIRIPVPGPGPSVTMSTCCSYEWYPQQSLNLAWSLTRSLRRTL